MKLRSNFDSAGAFCGFSVWMPCSGDAGDWSSASDYKAVVLARRRAACDPSATPLPTHQQPRAYRVAIYRSATR